MADVNANIDVNIDTSDALAQLKLLQRQLSHFHTSVAKSSATAAKAQADMQKNLLNNINAIGAFSAEIRTVKTSTESFNDSLEKNKFSMREYFRYAGASTKTFGRLFKTEFDTIGKVAEERVKRLQTQYIKLGRDTNGAMKAIAVMPNMLDMKSHSVQVQIAAQKQAILNQLLKQGSTNLLNFGKNTQWAGRQLMVGFTLPLAALGQTASKTFMDMETAALKFRKVYGDLLAPASETQAALDNITELGKQFTKYGIAVSDTVSLAAEAAAAGFQGLDLQRQTTEATRLSVLGQIDAQQALDTTIALQNAFKMSSEDLAGAINFLNSVENQTVTSLDDITIAIPKVAPVIQSLGGDVKDLAYFLTAMKEGGINASEGANALKSGLASLINPTSKATAMLESLGININSIVEKNQGNLRATVLEFAKALQTLDPLARSRAIEQMFGKFQFARLSTLFQNVTQDGTQAARVLDLAGASVGDLATQAEEELGMTAGSAMNKFRKAIEDLKAALVPVGEVFLKSVVPILEFFGGILEKFNNLSDGTKKIITVLTVAIGGIGPVLLMTFGLLANGVANIIKLFATLRAGYLKLTGQSQILGEQTQYLTMEQLEANAAAHSLNQSHASLTQTFNVEKSALDQLTLAYQSATRAATAFAANNPGMMLPGRKVNVNKYANGKPYVVGGTGNKDSEPAMLAPGETVIPADMSKKYGGLINGMIAGNIPGYRRGRKSVADRSANVDIYGDFALFLQDATENQSQQATVPGLANVLSLLTARVGEARGLGFSQTTTAGAYPDIIAEYTPIVQEFLANVEAEMARTESSIENSTERLARAWQIAGLAVEDELNEIQNPDERMAVRRALGVEQDRYGSVAGEFTAKRGWRGRTKRYKDGPVSYKDSGYRKAVKSAFRQIAGVDPKGMDFGHVFDKNTRSILGMPTSIPLSELRADPATSPTTLAGIDASIEKEKAKEIARANASAYEAIIEEETEDIYLATRDRKSPHPQAAKDGKDDAIAYQKAVKTQAKKARRGTRAQGPAPIGPSTPAGATMLPVVSKPTKSDLRRTAIRDRFAPIKNKISGRLGGGAGLGVSTGLMMASQFLPGNVGNILGNISSIGFAVQSLSMLPGPAKIAGAALLGVGVTAKALSKVQESQRLEVYGLGEVTKITGKKLETLGNFFGVAAKKLPYENIRTSSVAMPVGAQQRSQIDELRANKDFQNSFKNDISALQTATKEDATMVLNSLAIQLKGRGYASEQIKTIIQALQEEAGRTDLNLNFKNIGIATEDVVRQQVGVAVKRIVQSLPTFYIPVDFNLDPDALSGTTATATTLSDETVKIFEAASSSIFGIIQGMIGQFQAGTLSAADFNSQFKALSQEIMKMPKAPQVELISRMFVNLGPNAAKAVSGIKGVNDQLKVMVALSSDVIATDDPILKVLKTATDSRVLGRAQMQLSRKLREFYKIFEDETKSGTDEVVKTTTTGNDKIKNAFNFATWLTDSINAINDQAAAFDKLKKAGLDAADAMELAKNADIAAWVAKKPLTKEIKAQVKEYLRLKKVQEEEAKAFEESQKTISEKETDALNQKLAMFNLQEEIIKAKYASDLEDQNNALAKQEYELELVNRKLKEQQDLLDATIKPKQDRIDEINFLLEGISFKEDEINDKYDKQGKLLSTISQLNQDIYSIQKKRISLADALSTGDISAAAMIISEMKAEQAASQASSQQEVLDAAREQELNALGRKALEAESKKLQYDILVIQRNQSKELENQQKTLEDGIATIQDNITDIERKSAVAIQEINNNLAKSFAATKGQIQAALSILDLSKAAGIDVNNKTFITNVMKAATGEADALNEKLKEIIKNMGTISGGSGTGTANPDSTQGYTSDAPWMPTPPAGTANPDSTQGYTSDAPWMPTPPAGTSTTDSSAPLDLGSISVTAPVIDLGGSLDGLNIFGNDFSSGIFAPDFSWTDWAASLGLSTGGMVPKYFAKGGFSRGTDTVPAMLTPGEYVINKSAVDGLGVGTLNRINNGEMPAGAVYNYKVDVTLNGSDMDPNDVANAVLTKIKQLESRNIRRNTI